MRSSSRNVALCVVAAGLLATVAGTSTAQCTAGWIPRTSQSDMSALIRWLRMWDPDGAGPLAPVLAAGGDFNGANSAGTSSANYIATWDGTNWSTLGTGLDGPGYCLTSLTSTNHLYVCGTSFFNAGGVSARRVAEWSGSAWSGFGTGTGNTPALTPLAICAMDADTFVITGAFTSVAGVPANRVAAYNPANGWFALGSGMSTTTSACITLQNGHVVVGGASLTTGDTLTTINRIAEWDGTNWNPLGSGVDGLVRHLVVAPNGDLLVGGAFNNAGGNPAARIARWNGSTWSSIGSGMNGDVYSIVVLPNGHIVAGGDFTTAGGNPANRIAEWDGTTWSAYGSGLPALVRALAVLPDGDLAVGGDFTIAGGLPSLRFARYHYCANTCTADFNGDTVVDFFDYLDFVDAFSSQLPSSDFNRDSVIDFFDYLDFVDAFSTGC